MRERDVFIEVLQQPDPLRRAALLDDACQGDAALRKQVEQLLFEHERQESFLIDKPPQGFAATLDISPLSERPGTAIGPYKLLQQIGEGGMGVVFMAEQTRPIQRSVALKIIKPGMDTRQVVARFEAERQALAIMDHPNIAKVLDAGSTSSGRAYFVMELVKGVPITQYCDERRLPLRARLELMLPVCRAVQHAHHKGLIHRDIKPSNVLVAEYDDRAVPKVIDFGVAKATAQKLTERTMFTEFGQVVGTMEYMSPEQAKLNQLDVDTRSDIYSLGVMLYELLAGSTPFGGERLRQASFEEMLRIIREEDPPKPSTRLSTAEGLPSIAINRGSEPVQLNRLVRGELDWVVMKALEKDRNRRYETANGLAADIEHYLNGKAVEACPPSSSYRFRKFSRRNRNRLVAGALLATSLIVAASGIGWAIRDRGAHQEQIAQERAVRQAKTTGQLEIILDEVARLELAESWSDALVAARRAEPLLVTGDALPEAQKRTRQMLDDLQLVQRLEEAPSLSGTPWGEVSDRRGWSARSNQMYADAFRAAGVDIDSLPSQDVAAWIALRGPIAAALLPAFDDWVAVRSSRGNEAEMGQLVEILRIADRDPWRQQIRDALNRKDWPQLAILAKSPDVDHQPAATLSFLSAVLHANQVLFEETDSVLQRAQWKYPNDFWINHRLGVNLTYRQSPNDIRDGIGYLRAAVALRPASDHAVMNLGGGFLFLRQYDNAIACFRKSIELHPKSYGAYVNLGTALARYGRFAEAIAAFEQAIQLLSASSSRQTGEAYAELSMILSNSSDTSLRNLERATQLAEKALQFESNVSNHWTALGIARYRLDDWPGAHAALHKSLELKADGSGGVRRWDVAINWLFLALTDWQLGQQDEARKCYARAVEYWTIALSDQSEDQLLLQTRAAAEALLNIEVEERQVPPQSN